MLKKQIKKININITTIIVCVIAIFAFGFHVSAQVQFTEDTIISLSGITDGDFLKIASSSECATINTDNAILTITGIPIANDFILRTESSSQLHSNALKLTPTGGILGLTLDSGSISSGNIT